MFNKVNIVLTNRSLIEDATGPFKGQKLHRNTSFLKGLLFAAGSSILTLEGAEWVHRRKFLTKILNFDFISSHIPNMITIADNVLDELEQKSQLCTSG